MDLRAALAEIHGLQFKVAMMTKFPSDQKEQGGANLSQLQAAATQLAD